MKKRYATHVTLPSGRRVYVSASSQSMLDQKVREIRIAGACGVDPDDQTTLGELTALWWKLYKVPTQKPSSLKTLGHIRDAILKLPIANAPVKKLRSAEIQLALLEADMGPTFRVSVARRLQEILRLAEEQKIIVAAPKISIASLPKGPQHEKAALSREDSDTLLRMTRPFSQTHLFVALGLMTGMRRAEILGLRWANVDLNSGTIQVRRTRVFADQDVVDEETTKSSAGRRDLPIPQELRKLLQQIRSAEPEGVYVIHKPDDPSEGVSPRDFAKLWYPVKCLCPGGRTAMLSTQVTPHILRHTYISRLAAAGAPPATLQHLAGHASPVVTLGVYTHYMADQRDATTDLIRRAFADAPRES